MKLRLSQPYSYIQKGRRPNQEDARFPDCDTPEGCKPVFIVCDGVGGHQKGEVASHTVANAMGKSMNGFDLSRPFTGADFGKVLDDAYNALYKAMTPSTRDMATTMTFVCFSESGVFCAHMGDSRIYHVRPGVGILYRSEDHSLVNALVHSGNISPEEALNHPKSNVITKCFAYVEEGEDKPSATAIEIKDVEAGDYFFLCTDGVVHCLPDDELLEILSKDMPDKEKMAAIAAKTAGSPDNNTAYLIRIEEVIYSPGERPEPDLADDTDDSSTTASLSEVTCAKEIYPVKKEKASKLSKFFNALFS